MKFPRATSAALAVAFIVAGSGLPSAANAGFLGGDQCLGDVRGDQRRVASLLLEGKLEIPPFPPVQIGTDPDWSIDPFKNANWVEKFHSLGYTEALRREYLRTGDVSYFLRWREIIEDWINDNPRGDSPSWASWWRRVVGHRAMILACAVDLFPPTPFWRGALADHGSALAEEGFYVGRGNHALWQTSGLMAVACKLGRRDWADLSIKRLDRLARESIDDEGGINEGSLMYAQLNYLWYGEAVQRAARCGLSVPEVIEPARRRLMQFVVSGALPDGTFPIVGNSTPGRLRMLSPEARYLLTGGVKGRWPGPSHRWFRKAGWVFDRSSWTDPDAAHLVLRTGRVPVHNHEDQGSFVLSAFGRRLLEEGGMYGYHTPLNWWFKGPNAHNLLLVDDTPVLQRDARVEQSLGRGWAAYRLDLQQWRGVRWQRTIVTIGGGNVVVVIDRARSVRPKTYRQVWHLAPDSNPVIQGDAVRTRFDRGNLSVATAGDAGRPRIVEGRRGARMQGWISYRLAQMQPAPTIESIRQGKRVRLVTVLATGLKAPAIKIRQAEFAGRAVDVHALIGGRALRIKDSGHGAPTVRY